MSSQILRILVPNQPLRELVLVPGQAVVVPVQPGAVYAVFDAETNDVVEDVVLNKVDDNLIINLDGEALVQVDGFFAPVADSTPTTDGTAESATNYVDAGVTDATGVPGSDMHSAPDAQSYVYTGATDASGGALFFSSADPLVAASDVTWDGLQDAGAAVGTWGTWALVGLGVAGAAVAATTMSGGGDTAASSSTTSYVDVVFNLSAGTETIEGLTVASGASASDQGGTAFLTGTDYRITIIVNNTTNTLATMTTWTGGANLGAGDVVRLVGTVANDSGELTRSAKNATRVTNTANNRADLFNSTNKFAALIRSNGMVDRNVGGSVSRDIWTGSADFNGSTTGNSILLEFV